MGVTGDDSFERAKTGVLRELYDGADPVAAHLARAFDLARDRAATLAATIATAMPDYTDHSVTHLDALWDYVALLHGDEPLSPAEAFVLGGAVLLHDLAMTPAAYPGGFPGTEGEAELRDLVAQILRRGLGRAPTAEEIDACSPAVRHRATQAYLRRHHAEAARALATRDLETGANESGELFVIQDKELRRHFGDTIGEIAQSHWWYHDQLVQELAAKPALQAPIELGRDWPVDRLRTACLLRCADAAHLDSRRARDLRRHMQGPGTDSRPHWDFQERVTAVHLDGTALVYQAPTGFPVEYAPAWWLAFHTMHDVVDHELRGCDRILRAHGRPPFRARSVFGVEAPERFADVFPPLGWKPIDAQVKVADTPRLIELLGGAQLYGDRPDVVLRELVQNARDAIAARRAVDSSFDQGTITVDLDHGSDDRPATLTVSDDGVGMTELGITGRLLVLGSSSWSGEDLIDELPGLASSDFEPVGRFGIGFFSLTMVAEAVQVTTRHLDAAPAETLVVELGEGFGGTPLLRPADASQRRRTPGTAVRLILRADDLRRMLRVDQSAYQDDPIDPVRALTRLCPMLDCRLVVRIDGEPVIDLAADRWLTMTEPELGLFSDPRSTRVVEVAPDTAVTLHDDAGRAIARLAIAPGASPAGSRNVVKSVGGLFASAVDSYPLMGVVRATASRISRNDATCVLPDTAALALWASLTRWLDEHPDAPDNAIAAVFGLASLIVPDEDPLVWTLGEGFVRLSAIDPPLADRDTVTVATTSARGRTQPSALRAPGRRLIKQDSSLPAGQALYPIEDLHVEYRESPFRGILHRQRTGAPNLTRRVFARRVAGAFDRGASVGPATAGLSPASALVTFGSAISAEAPVWAADPWWAAIDAKDRPTALRTVGLVARRGPVAVQKPAERATLEHIGLTVDGLLRLHAQAEETLQALLSSPLLRPEDRDDGIAGLLTRPPIVEGRKLDDTPYVIADASHLDLALAEDLLVGRVAPEDVWPKDSETA